VQAVSDNANPIANAHGATKRFIEKYPRCCNDVRDMGANHGDAEAPCCHEAVK
jgi:hypothetical protein